VSECVYALMCNAPKGVNLNLKRLLFRALEWQQKRIDLDVEIFIKIVGGGYSQ